MSIGCQEQHLRTPGGVLHRDRHNGTNHFIAIDGVEEKPFAEDNLNLLRHRHLPRIRKSGPIHYMDDPPMGVPYWLVTGRDEIDFISKNPSLFSSEARTALAVSTPSADWSTPGPPTCCATWWGGCWAPADRTGAGCQPCRTGSGWASDFRTDAVRFSI